MSWLRRAARAFVGAATFLAVGGLWTLAAYPAAAQGTRTAEVVFVVDESGSMSGEQDFLQTFVPSLEQQLLASGLQAVRFGLVGYGNSAVVPRQFLIAGQALGSATDWSTAAGALEVSGGTEDGYAGIQYVLDNYAFASGANTVVIVLVTDEDRDNTDGTLNFQVILANLQNSNASLSGILNQEIRAPGGETALATDGSVTFIDANNDGVPEQAGAPTFGEAGGATFEDYTQLVLSFSDACVADLNQLRAGGTSAQAFATTLARCLVQQALGGSGADQFLIAPSVAGRLAALNFSDALLFRLSGRYGGFDGGSGDDTQAFSMNAAGTRRAFAIASYTDGSADPIGGQSGFDFKGWQLILGADWDVSEKALVGVSLGYTDGESEADDRQDRWEHEIITLAGYGSLELPHGLQLDGIASYGFADYKVRREVIATSPGADSAIASPDGNVVALRTRLSRSGYKAFGDRIELTPHVGAAYSRVEVNAYQETGPGAVAIEDFAHEVTTLDLGVEAQGALERSWGVVRPSVQLGAEYAVSGEDEAVRIRTPLGGSFEQVVPGADDWTTVVGVGVALTGDRVRDGDQRFAIRFGYEGRFGEDYESHGVSLRGRISF